MGDVPDGVVVVGESLEIRTSYVELFDFLKNAPLYDKIIAQAIVALDETLCCEDIKEGLELFAKAFSLLHGHWWETFDESVRRDRED